MKRTLIALVLVAAACADNRTSIEITGRAAQADATSCTFDPSGKNLLGPGTLDVSFGSMTYSTVLYVTNNIADPVTTVPEATTASKAWRASAARVRVNPQEYLDRFGASPALLPFQGENTLPLDGQTTPPGGGKTAQLVDVISRSLGAQIGAAQASAGETRRVVLGITLEGLTLDGARVDSGEWYFPVDVCNGCLQPASATCADPAQVLIPGNCFGFGQDTVPSCATP